MWKSNPFSLLLILLLLLFASAKISAQQVKIKANNQALNKVLIELGKNYDVQFSFNNELLAACFISADKTYDSPKQAITELVKNCQLTFKINAGVFVIYKAAVQKKIIRSKTFKGIVLDAINGEPLPYSTLQINTTSLTTDGNGNFSFRSKDSTFHLRVSYVGYYLKDTLVKEGKYLKVKLTPSVVGLSEFVISAASDIQMATVGERAGLVKVNSKVAQFLPGNRANTVFNLLRLQPGILAAGEQTNDYLLWGAYKGQTQIIFDGITLFNIGSSTDHIGAINPFITKDIEVYKGGYNVQFGDRTGGVVNITGTMGVPKKIGAQLSVDNQLTNGLINVPLGNKNVLQLMFRRSYFDLMSIKSAKKYDNSYTIDQQFTDANIKLSGFGENGDQYFISLLGNKDDVTYDITDKEKALFERYHKGTQEQTGGSAYYGKNWKGAGQTNFTLAHSNLTVLSSDSRVYNDSLKTNQANLLNATVTNGVSETSLKIEHHFPTSRKQTWLVGLGLVHNETTFIEATKRAENKATRMNGFVKNDISLAKKISVEPGIRVDLPLTNQKAYLQPRIQFILKPFQYWKVNIAAGTYHQFLVENPIFDSIGNHYNYWGITDEKLIPVIKGIHYVSGISYRKNDLTISAEGFYKTNDNLSRLTVEANSSELTFVYGKSRSIGLDFFIKKKINSHQFWIGYSISQTKELFTNFVNNTFQPAPHDQLHEVKVASLFNFDPLYLSFNYVYGSGLFNSEQLSSSEKIIPYSRFDAALLHQFNTPKYKLEMGVSILNVFNSFNVRYNNFSSFPSSDTAYQQALPFTPTLMFKFSF